jgi:hypothetical protein
MTSTESSSELATLILESYFTAPSKNRLNRNNLSSGHSAGGVPMSWGLPIYLDTSRLSKAAILLRSLNAKTFGSIPFGQTLSYIDGLFCSHISKFLNARAPHNVDVHYLELIVGDKLSDFNKFAVDQILKGPAVKTNSFPLCQIRVDDSYHGTEFYLVGDGDLDIGKLEDIANVSSRMKISAWIGCSAPFDELTHKIKRVALGAIALRLSHVNRTQKTIAIAPTGFLNHNDLSWSSSIEHVPPIGDEIVIGTAEHWWLAKIDEILGSAEKVTRRLRKALEYHYFGWFRSDNERVPFNFMSLDAIFGQGNEPSGVKLKRGILNTLDMNLDETRLDDIFLIRNQFIHGGCPDIFDSSLYESYLKKYNCDPTIDIDYLTASCLRKSTFGTQFEMQPITQEKILNQLRSSGILPSAPEQLTIISEC